MSDSLTTAVMSAIDSGEAKRLEDYRCEQRCRLAGVFRIRGSVVWVTFGRVPGDPIREPKAYQSRPAGPLLLQCRKHAAVEVTFRD